MLCQSQCSTAAFTKTCTLMVTMLPLKRCPEAAACMPLMILCSPGSAVAQAWWAPSGPPSALRALPPPHHCHSARPCQTARAEPSCPHAGRHSKVRLNCYDSRPGLQGWGRAPCTLLRGLLWRACPPAPPGTRTLRHAHAQHLLEFLRGLGEMLQTNGRLRGLRALIMSRDCTGDSFAQFVT